MIAMIRIKWMTFRLLTGAARNEAISSQNEAGEKLHRCAVLGEI